MGHARALLALDGDVQTTTARTVAAKELTVRETEKLVKKVQEPVVEKQAPVKDANTVKLEENLAERIGSPVTIKHNKKGKGQMVISYASLEELDGILSKIK